MNVDDTIVAVASAPGGAFRGIVRISGPQTVACLKRLFQSGTAIDLEQVRQPQVLPGHLFVSDEIGPLPCDLCLWPSQRSYTRQPSAEVHTIGSPPLLDAAVQTLCGAGARLAQPGEFTLRAFLAGRLDLTQAEAVLGVIDAQSQRELDAALSQLAGGLAKPLQTLRDRLLDLLAHLEAGLDFVEDDIEFISTAELTGQLDEAITQVQTLAEQMRQRQSQTANHRVALVGWPNVGKSSLLNALSGEDTAIVSEVAGTTRDYLTKRATIGGLDCLLIDTAGFEAARSEHLTVAAQAMTDTQAGQAHLCLFCIDASRPLNDWETARIGQIQSAEHLFVLTKVDAPRQTNFAGQAVPTSSLTGTGIDELRAAIAARLTARSSGESGTVAGTAVRCYASLCLAEEGLQRARRAAAESWGEEIVAAEIRVALDELGTVVGAVYTDDVLDRIFSRFCIGK